ncbi:MAG: hypothetical protein ACP5PC_07990 [bacterium]
MIKSNAYGVTPQWLDEHYNSIVSACHKQNITHIGITTSITGKLLTSPEKLRELKERLINDGITCWAEIVSIGHPAMGKYYDPLGRPPTPDLFWDGDLIITPGDNVELLPRGWQYAINEFGNPVYCTACPNEAWLKRNLRVLNELAPIFDEIWYDDDFRLDGDQGAGKPHTSTAACYCDECLEELSKRVGNRIMREDILSDQALHNAWIEAKVDKLTSMWDILSHTAHQINPKLRLGLMVRWGGEERDGIDIDKILSHSGSDILLRAGEGHFTRDEFNLPENQAIEYLVTSYHISWFPPKTKVWSETTYFTGITEEDILKKIALALASGAQELSYCPCVPEWIEEQNFLSEKLEFIKRLGNIFSNAELIYQPIAILRTKSAGYGDRFPLQRVRDRQPFPLFSLAGLCAQVIRQNHWCDTGNQKILAVTGRSVWDFDLDDLGDRHLILDGSALLENSPLNAELGLANITKTLDGRVNFSGGIFTSDGLLYSSSRITIIPYVWQDVPESLLNQLLYDIRRVIGSKALSVVVEGDLYVLPVHYRHNDYDAILLVNLTHSPREIALYLKDTRTHLYDQGGMPIDKHLILAPDEIRIIIARD